MPTQFPVQFGWSFLQEKIIIVKINKEILGSIYLALRVIVLRHLKILERCTKVVAYVLRLCAGRVIEFLLPGTVAKFINKCSLLLLQLNNVFSAGTMAETCTNAHCQHFSPACTKPML